MEAETGEDASRIQSPARGAGGEEARGAGGEASGGEQPLDEAEVERALRALLTFDATKTPDALPTPNRPAGTSKSIFSLSERTLFPNQPGLTALGLPPRDSPLLPSRSLSRGSNHSMSSLDGGHTHTSRSPSSRRNVENQSSSVGDILRGRGRGRSGGAGMRSSASAPLARDWRRSTHQQQHQTDKELVLAPLSRPARPGSVEWTRLYLGSTRSHDPETTVLSSLTTPLLDSQASSRLHGHGHHHHARRRNVEHTTREEEQHSQKCLQNFPAPGDPLVNPEADKPASSSPAGFCPLLSTRESALRAATVCLLWTMFNLVVWGGTLCSRDFGPHAIQNYLIIGYGVG